MVISDLLYAPRCTHLLTRFLQVVYGRWLIDGYPKVILFDIGSAAHKLSEWRRELFEKCHIGIPDGDIESNDCLLFGFLTCWFISEVGLQFILLEVFDFKL